MALMKTVVRAGLIAALAGGAAVAIAGPDRIGALVTQTRGSVNKVIDGAITDPVALRKQLRDLESEYPRRIADVTNDLREVDNQIAQLQRDMAVAQRVVRMADEDLAQMKDLLARAEDARVSSGGVHVVKVRFDGQSLSVDDAYAKADKISKIRSAFATQSADLEKELGYLTDQQARLKDVLNQLQTERAQFQTQMWQLDRQVDTIARNDRLIELMEKRQRTIDEQSRYQGISLEHLHGRLADIRSHQEAKLESLTKNKDTIDYETRAKIQLDQAGSGADPFVLPAPAVEVEPSVIEIGPEDHGEGENFASANPHRNGHR